jgi:D-cysteine desulfhydrase
MRQPLIFERFPALRERLAWLPLAAGTPTPVEQIRLFDADRLFVKRDDRTSAIYGGNKVRKLEWILGEARRRGRRAVVTAGALGSHHCLATARFARESGLRATLILYPQPMTPHVEEVFAASRATGARIVRTRSIPATPLAALRAYAACVLSGEGWPYRVAVGGSDAHGTLGYVECGLEIAAQVASGALPPPDFVYAAAGTCGTIAGLALGLGLAGLGGARVLGVRVVPAFITNASRTLGLIRGAARLLGVEASAAVPFEILGDQLGAGYGLATPAAEEARSLARAAGLDSETTYTAKALAGVRAHAAAPERRAKVHLYVHTLGALESKP